MNTKRYSYKTFDVSSLVLFILGIFFFSACGLQTKIATKPVFTPHESGISYQITNKGHGPKSAINDILKVHYILMLEDSTVVDNSHERGEPVSFKLGAGQVIKGWDIAFTMLSEGDEAILRIPANLAYGDKPMGDIPANAPLIFNVKLVDVLPAPKPYVIEDESQIIQTSSGLRYVIVRKGRGKELNAGMRVKVHYSGFFEDMHMFDSSLEREQPIDITLGRGMVIKGWEEGLSNLRVGDKARLWIPYQLAYGEPGRSPIPPKANLIFDIEVIDASEIPRAIPYNVSGKDTLQTESGLKYIIVNSGSGNYPQSGDIVSVHYTGFLPDGTMFDSSIERDQPFRFVLGQNQVIAGWDEGISLMRAKARYRFIIPAELAYGIRGAGPIPPNETIIFDVELLEIDL